jgi:hypothetical protein
MADPVLVPCLVSLRHEFDVLAPHRDTESDGWIGDTAHQQEPSDHNPDETGNTPYKDADNTNEVHALDVDSDLNEPGWSMQRAVDIVVGRHRSGQDDRLNYVIYNRRIWASPDWSEREYTGPSAHTEHGHFSARYTTAQERDTRAWGLLEAQEDDVALTQEDKNWLLDHVGPQPVASKIGTDLGTKGSGIYKYTVSRVTEGTAAGFASLITAISQLDNVDETALAEAMVPALSAALLAGLQGEAGGSALTEDQITEAVKRAFREGSGTEEDQAA